MDKRAKQLCDHIGKMVSLSILSGFSFEEGAIMAKAMLMMYERVEAKLDCDSNATTLALQNFVEQEVGKMKYKRN